MERQREVMEREEMSKRGGDGERGGDEEREVLEREGGNGERGR